jgi:hypothetical protein
MKILTNFCGKAKPKTPERKNKKTLYLCLQKISILYKPTNYKMKVDQKGHTVTIKDTQGDFKSFLEKVTQQFKTFEKQNIIIDLTSDSNLSESDLKLFLPLSKQQKKAKKSFVIVAFELDFNAVSDKLTVVPSLLEAHDIIEMEEIERDLGF